MRSPGQAQVIIFQIKVFAQKWSLSWCWLVWKGCRAVLLKLSPILRPLGELWKILMHRPHSMLRVRDAGIDIFSSVLFPEWLQCTAKSKRASALGPCCPRCDLQTSSTDVTWDLLGHADSQVLPASSWISLHFNNWQVVHCILNSRSAVTENRMNV